MARVTATVSVALLAFLGIQGCSEESKNPVALTVIASEPEAGKYAFDVPASVEGGVVKIELKNTGKEPHDLQLIKVKDGTAPEKLVEDLLESEGAPFPDYMLDGAGGVGTIAPGATSTVTQELDAGTYVYYCSIDGDTGPHYENGMLGAVTLKGDKGKGDLPKAEGSIKAKEYGYEFSGLKAGSNTITFENTGQQFHHAQILPVSPGKTFEEAKAAFLSQEEPTGPPPVEFEKAVGTAMLAPGEKQVQTNLTLESRTYLVVCFIPDKTGGPPHLVKGMAQQLDLS